MNSFNKLYRHSLCSTVSWLLRTYRNYADGVPTCVVLTLRGTEHKQIDTGHIGTQPASDVIYKEIKRDTALERECPDITAAGVVREGLTGEWYLR